MNKLLLLPIKYYVLFLHLILENVRYSDVRYLDHVCSCNTYQKSFMVDLWRFNQPLKGVRQDEEWNEDLKYKSKVKSWTV